jgi:hypothetical protein
MNTKLFSYMFCELLLLINLGVIVFCLMFIVFVFNFAYDFDLLRNLWKFWHWLWNLFVGIWISLLILRWLGFKKGFKSLFDLIGLESWIFW